MNTEKYNQSNNENDWIPLAEAAQFTPYSAEYLSLLARKGRLVAKKVDGIWYTTRTVVNTYLSEQAKRAEVLNRDPNTYRPFISDSKTESELVASAPVVSVPEIPVVPVAKEVVEEKITKPEAVVVPVPAYAAAGGDKLIEEFMRRFNAHIDAQVDREHGYLFKIGRFVRRAYRAVFSSPKLFATFAICLVLLVILPFRFVSGFAEKFFEGAVEVVKDAQTVMGFRPGTHANEILLLGPKGEISIFGNVETDGQFRSFVEDGIAPITVNSTTKVENLNADYLDGTSAHEFTLAFVTKNGNVTYEPVFLEGEVEVGSTLLVRGATRLLNHLSVGGELEVFGDATFQKSLTVNGPAIFKDLVTAPELVVDKLRVNKESSFGGNADFERDVNIDGGIVAGSGRIKGTFRVEESFHAMQNVSLGSDNYTVRVDSDNWSVDNDGNATFADVDGEDASFDSLTVSGNLSAGTFTATNANGTSTFAGGISLSGGLADASGSAGNDGYVLQSTGTSTRWVATSTLGFASGGNITSLNGLNDPNQFFATTSDTNIGLVIGSSGDTHTFNPTWSGVLSVARGGTGSSTASGARTNLGLGTIATLNTVDISDNTNLAVAATGLTLSDDTITLDSGYVIPLSASTTNWNNFFDSPSTRIGAGNGLSWSGNTLNSVWTAVGNDIYRNTSGNVGIGTTTPNYRLDIIQPTNTYGIRTSDLTTEVALGISSTGTGLIGTRTNQPLQLIQNANVRMTIDTAGNVGIGDTTPASLFTVGSGDAFQVNSSGTVLSGTWNGTDIDISDYTNLAVGNGITLTDDTLTVTAAGGLAQTTGGLTTTGILEDLNDLGVVPQAGQFIVSTGVGAFQYQGTSTVATALQAFIQNGNSFGTTATLGTNDSNNLDFETNNTTRMTVTTAGNVGIGTTTPATKVHIAGIGSGAAMTIGNTFSNESWRLYAANANNFVIDPGSVSDTFRFTSTGDFLVPSGNVGIGTLSATQTLTVAGSAVITGALFDSTNSSGTTGMILSSTGSGTAWVATSTLATNFFQQNGNSFGATAILGTNDSQDLRFETNNVGRMAIDTTGRVSIGTTTTVAAGLYVVSTSTDQFRLAYDTSNYWTDVVASDGGRTLTNTGTDGDIDFVLSGAMDGDFSVNGDDLFIDTSTGGFVGINTVSPSQYLQVNGAIVSTGAASTMTADGIYLQNKGSSIFDIGAWRTGANAGVLTFSTDSGSDSSPVERMRITQSGNVGIGTTTPASTLSVAGSMRLTGAFNDSTNSSGTTGMILSSTGSGTAWVATSTLATNFFQQNGNSFGTNATLGTNDANNLVFETNNTARVTIDTSGNVGIGTTTPLHLLQVYASSTATASPIASIKQNGTGDAGLMYLVGQTNSFVTGIDNSDSDSFKISYGSAGNAALGTNDYMTVTTAGMVGIGTAAPSSRLQVVAATSSNNVASFKSVNSEANVSIDNVGGSGRTILQFLDDGSLQWQLGKETNGTFFIFDTVASKKILSTTPTGNLYLMPDSGNVGIGTTTPATTLTVANSTGSPTPTPGIASGSFSLLGNTGLYGLYSGVSTNGSVWFQTMRNDATTTTYPLLLNPSGGNVGIGTSDPSGLLGLRSATAGDTLAWGATNGNYTNIFSSFSSAGLVLASGIMASTTNDTYASSNGSAMARAAIRLNPFGTDAGAIQFFTNSASTVARGTAITPTERMRITPTGDVGIGTTTPQGKLDVNGNIAMTGPVFIHRGFGDLDTTGNAYNSWQDSSTGTYVERGWVGFGASDSGVDLANNAGTVHLRATGSRRLSVLGNGNVGIGTTTPLGRLEVNGTMLTSIGSGGTLTLFDNVVSRSNQFIAGADASGGYINATYNNGGTGDLRLQTISSTRLIIKESGNVGIRNTSPSATLVVDGTNLVGSANQSTYDIAGGRIAAGDSIYSYGAICTSNAAGACNGSAGVVLGITNSSATVNIPTSGTSFFTSGVGIADTTPTEGTLTVGGTLYVLTNTAVGSDPLCWDGAGGSLYGDCSSLGKWKTNVEAYSAGLAEILAVEAVTFDWKRNADGTLTDGGSPDVLDPDTGFIADQVASVNYNFGRYSKENGALRDVNERAIMGAMVNAIKELNWKIEDLATTTPFVDLAPDSFTKRFFDRMIAWLGEAENGIGSLFAREIKTDELCVGEVCVDEASFLRMVQNAGSAYALEEEPEAGDDDNNSTSTDPIIDGEDDNATSTDPVLEEEPAEDEVVEEEPEEETPAEEPPAETIP